MVSTFQLTRSTRLTDAPKTHKSLHLAGMQLNSGVVGLTVAKLGEAEVMAAACGDLLVAYPAPDPWRAGRLASLAERAPLHVAVDSPETVSAPAMAAEAVGSMIGILVDLDVGMGRTGVPTPEAALALA